MMKTQLVSFPNSPKTALDIVPSTSSSLQFPDEILCKIVAHVPPKDRLKLQLVCRRFNSLFSQWADISAVEIRSEVYGCESQSTAASIFNFHPKPPRISFYVKLMDGYGNCHQMRTLQNRISFHMLKLLLARLTNIRQLTISESCLSLEFISTIRRLTTVKTLRLWNCSKYFEKKSRDKKLLYALLSLPNIDELLVLDDTPSSSNFASCLARFDKSCAQKIRPGAIKSIQLTGLHLPLSAFHILVDRLAPSCTRFIIGCTFGKEERRLDYLKTMMKLKLVNDLDLPPFLFTLNDLPVPDGVVDHLLNEDLPLKALGFRHYNSNALFRYIENNLPTKVRVLRIHHNANRIPNFSSLGQHREPDIPVKKKSSVYSILSASRSSISSSNAIDSVRIAAHNAAQMSSSGSFGSGTRDSALASSLAARTIFALAEDTKTHRNHRIRQKNYNGVDVFYIYETRATQEVFGRMASPMKSPHVYSRNMKKDCKIRIVKGDLVKPIPLASLGLEESDYELSDFED